MSSMMQARPFPFTMTRGGVYGKVVGITSITMTEAGAIIAMFQVLISTWIQLGEDTTGLILGTAIVGTLIGFLIEDFNRTERSGKMIGIGKGKEPGASRAINLDRSNRNRNLENRGTNNIKRA